MGNVIMLLAISNVLSWVLILMIVFAIRHDRRVARNNFEALANEVWPLRRFPEDHPQ